jgi:hypothetical protein
MKYQIASNNTTLGKFGKIVDEDDLGGCNIEALVAAGHLVPEPEVELPPIGKKATDNEKNGPEHD